MATGGTKRMYREEDIVDDDLLNQLSKWILYHCLEALAKDMGIPQAEIAQIMTPSKTHGEQIVQVNE